MMPSLFVVVLGLFFKFFSVDPGNLSVVVELCAVLITLSLKSM